MTQQSQRALDMVAAADTPPPGADGRLSGIAGRRTEAGQPAGTVPATSRPHNRMAGDDLGAASPPLASAEAECKAIESLPLPLVLELEQACGRFENAWQTAGSTRPSIEDYLTPEPQQECQPPFEEAAPLGRMRLALLRELVRIDIEYQHRAGQTPDAEEYLKRFPNLDRRWLGGALAALPKVQGPAGTHTAVGPGSTLPSRATPPRALPALFGDYELLEEVARGGMGVVYRARQVGLNRIVALKMIRAGGFFPEEAARRFHREAQAAAALDHPNIVAVYATGQHEGCPYYSMAYVEGDNLREVVSRLGLPAPRQAVAWLSAVAEAVAFAHRHGIIHRDLKPENVLLDGQGRPRVTDFGLACQFAAEGPADRLTHTGQVLGTPAYMSPEQALGHPEAIGAATDVYSMGGVLYFLLTGQAPFGGRTPSEVLVHVTTQTPTPPRAINPQASAALEAICLRCLEKDPTRRYPSAEALGKALRDTLQEDTQDDAEKSAGGSLPPSRQSTTLSSTLIGPLDRSTSGRGSRSRRTRIGLAAVALTALAAAVWFVVAARRPAGEWRQPPEKLRADFGLEVEMLDKDDKAIRPGDDGILQLRAQEALRFRVKVAEDAYVGIWSINSDGSVTQLVPNEDEKDHKFRKGEKRLVPLAPAHAALCDGETPFDWVWVQASTRAWDPDRGQSFGPFLLFKTDAHRGQWARQRGSIRLRREAALAEAVLKFRVVP